MPKRSIFFPSGFQSTLPYGSDQPPRIFKVTSHDFNPRSLTGATYDSSMTIGEILFQSTLPYGSDMTYEELLAFASISIHAPLRERPIWWHTSTQKPVFQSTLPYGSDVPPPRAAGTCAENFNPRSLTGATVAYGRSLAPKGISIHAPLRERQAGAKGMASVNNFNPRSLTGATRRGQRCQCHAAISIHAPLRERLSVHFEPPSVHFISIHAPLRERQQAQHPA